MWSPVRQQLQRLLAHPAPVSGLASALWQRSAHLLATGMLRRAQPAVQATLAQQMAAPVCLADSCCGGVLSTPHAMQQSPLLQQIAGFKLKRVLKRRCKDCYFVVRENRMHVICKTHPRHKQMAIVKPEKSTWILTHATQSKVRPW